MIKQEYKIGDCLELLPSIQDESIDLIFTDLPYGITACKWDSEINLEKLWEQYNRIIKDHGAIVLTATIKFANTLINSNPKMFRYDLIWEKSCSSGFLLANKMPLRKHELILVFYKHLPTFNLQYTEGEAYTDKGNIYSTGPIYGKPILKSPNINKSKRNPVSVLKFNTTKEHIHPTTKPQGLLEWIIKSYTNEGDLVHDSCLGSGSTMEACINLKRNFIGFELSDEWEYNYKGDKV